MLILAEALTVGLKASGVEAALKFEEDGECSAGAGAGAKGGAGVASSAGLQLVSWGKLPAYSEVKPDDENPLAGVELLV
ncbi:hypothetical protein PInf_004409 [Phytophthora infestans]|nr:hypothetical protein PInf_004409 [Phytophthora infestans]